MANQQLPEVIATTAADTVTETGHGGAVTHAEPELFGMAPFQIVALAMSGAGADHAVKRVPARSPAGSRQIAAIRQQLAKQRRLRAEAEQLRADFRQDRRR